jgi:hypothetical protein
VRRALRRWLARLLPAWLFSEFRWYRRLAGGHWERWYVDHPVCSDVWHDVPACGAAEDRRPTVICRGTPTCEDHDVP